MAAFPELKVALQQIIDYIESTLSGITPTAPTGKDIVDIYGGGAGAHRAADSAADHEDDGRCGDGFCWQLGGCDCRRCGGSADIVAGSSEVKAAVDTNTAEYGKMTDALVRLKRMGAA
jgi:hypothetical protein